MGRIITRAAVGLDLDATGPGKAVVRGMLSADMGQTRVDLQHLLEDLRDAYPDAIEETILSEIVANSLDSGATSIRVLTDPSEKTVVVVDDGRGMSRRELARYHDLAASSKTRGEGIGFAGSRHQAGSVGSRSRPHREPSRPGARGVAVASRRRATRRPGSGWRRPLASGSAAPPWGSRLRNPLSPLLDAGYVESCLRRTSSRCSSRPSTRSWPSAMRRVWPST